MKAFTILICALCLSMAFGNTESLLKAANQHTEHSVHPRQTNCDVSQLQNYPSDCQEAVNTIGTSVTSGIIPAVLCEPRCGQPLINFYFTCGLDFVVPAFVQSCGTNAMGQICGTEVVQMAINHTSIEISSNCIGTIVFGSNCTTECRNTLTNARQSVGCCIQLLNTTAITPNFINPVIDPQLWERSCGVDLPTACPSSLTPTITDDDTAAPTTDGPQTTPPVVDNVATQSCSTPFEAVMAVVTDLVVPASSLQFADPEMKFFTETLRFTAEETNQVMENAIQHFNNQFGIDFSNVEPNEANQRFFEYGTFEPIATPFNDTVIANRWIVNGNTRSKCFPMGSGYFSIIFNTTTMLHGVYGGERGKQINANDFVNYGYIAFFGTCAQQPILIQLQSDVPARRLPVEGWTVEEYRSYNRQLGRGRAQSVLKSRPSPDDPTMLTVEGQRVFSFP